MMAWNIFYHNILQNCIIRSGDKIILAVSGGMDSMCMLHLFWRLGKKINIDLLVTNFNHKLRKESFKEAEFVKDFSGKLGVRCFLETIDVKEYSKKESISIETAGRNLRYLVLEKIARNNKFNKIATAHNANDNAETLFMWLLRGAGDFIGIPHVRKIKENLDIIRPLLPVKRKLIEAYVEKNKIPFCSDQSNFSNIYTRNKIRHSLIPICEEINPKAIEHIYSLSCIRAREDSFFEHISNKFLKKCVEIKKDIISLDLDMFLRYNSAIRFRIIESVLPQKKCSLHVNQVMRKILLSDKSVYRLSGGWLFKIKSGKACFFREPGIVSGKR